MTLAWQRKVDKAFCVLVALFLFCETQLSLESALWSSSEKSSWSLNSGISLVGIVCQQRVFKITAGA